MIWNVQQAIKMHPKITPGRSRASQTHPKWSPRPSPIQFLYDFVAFIFTLHICLDFLLMLNQFFVIFQNLKPLILSLLSRRNAIFRNVAIFKNSSKKHRKIIENPSPNPPQTSKNHFKKHQKTEQKYKIT